MIPVILSGGAGTRLWPVSREGHPKPFMQLADGESLLRKTYQRAAKVTSPQEILTVTNRNYYFMSRDEFAKSTFATAPRASFLLEPLGRNTAPAIAMAALYIAHKFGPDERMLVLPADHLIGDENAFAQAVSQADALAVQGKLVTFGIEPTGPETGFGYIECGESMGVGKRVQRFVEKPQFNVACEYVKSGNYLWNAGMFCFCAGSIIEELKKNAPEVFNVASECWNKLGASTIEVDSMIDIPEDQFAAAPDISIDYAVMERSSNVAVVPCKLGWSDIGSWNAVSELAQADENDNRALGDAIFVDTKNTFVQSEGRLVAAVGVDDLLIIDTADALLVSHVNKSQGVKQVVAQLKLRKHEAYKLHRTVARPWGTYTVLEEGPSFKIKRIEVKSGASLSLQMHHHRSEHWIVVKGMAKVVNGENELFVRTNESTYIPAGHKHRLENPGMVDLVMIEVQSGEYLGEDDIVRFEDIYGRA